VVAETADDVAVMRYGRIVERGPVDDIFYHARHPYTKRLLASTLKLEGGDTRVLVKEYQLDPIDHKLLHADFYQVAMDKTITVTVPIVLKGEAKGVKQQGGIVDFVNREIEIEVLPGNIPENITVDISELMLHEGVRVRELQSGGAKWKATSDPDMMIVHVVTLRVEEEPAPADAVAAAATAAPAEPEVIKKGKVEKPEEEAAAKEKK